MKRTLLIYGSRKGITEMTAQVVAEILILKHGHIVEITNIKRIRKYRRHLNEFDNIIVGSSIISGQWVRRVLRFLKRNDLSNHKVALFITAGITINKAFSNEIPKDVAVAQAIHEYIDVYARDFKFTPVSKNAFGGVFKSGGRLLNSWSRTDIESWAMYLGTILS